jgi:putative nucleotidyltransferase with HDIG domain
MTASPSPVERGAPGREPSRELKALPSTINEDQVKRIISVTGNLPPVPHVAAKMMELVGKEDTSVRDLQRVISADQALTARILKMANSVFYSFDQKITTLSHAIVILGFRAVQSMSVAASSRSLFVKKGSQFGLKEKLLWEHSMGVAMSCRQVARTVGFENEEAAFIAGLLHDIGKAVLNQVIPKKYARIVEQVYNEGRSFADVEQETLGFDHSHIGALIAQKWNFDWDMVETIAYHHRPEAQSSGAVLGSVLALSNVLCKGMGVGLERTPEGSSPADHWSAGRLGLDGSACSEIQEIVRSGLEEEKKLYAL